MIHIDGHDILTTLEEASPPPADWKMPGALLDASFEQNLSVRAAYRAYTALLKPVERRNKKDWLDLIQALAVSGDLFISE